MNEFIADKEKVIQGFFIAFLSVLIQQLLETSYWQVYVKIEESITLEDSGTLILAAAVLVALNSAKALPIFVGAFRAIEGLKKTGGIGAALMAALMIIVFYSIIYGLQPGQWNWGVPLVVFLFGIILLLIWGRGVLKGWHKIIIFSQLLMGSYWLAITPGLTFIGFGQDETSSSIKLVAQYLEADSALNFFSFAFFAPMLIIAIITMGLIDNYSKIIKHINAGKEQEKQMRKVRVAAAQARVLEELHALVHDLKTPLTTIQGLSSLLGMTGSNDKRQAYVAKIENSVENMNGMISEILYEDVRKPITVNSLINYVRAQIIPENLNQKFYFQVQEDLPEINVNKVRLARALVNVIENAIRATENKPDGEIYITAQEKGSSIIFTVEDNGVGISKDDIERIWEPGFSSSLSSGLGLTFVRKVIENHGGEIDITSEFGKGAKVTMSLPRGQVKA